jgi:hypothetical protein
MPFTGSIDLLKKIISIIDNKIIKNENFDKSIKQENESFYLNLKKINNAFCLMIDKLKSYKKLSLTTEEVQDLKQHHSNLFNSLKNVYEMLNYIEKTHRELVLKRNLYKTKWYLCVACYYKSTFLEDLQNLNKEVNVKIDLVHCEFDNLNNLMSIYEKEIIYSTIV